jgi:hypothetical protein
MNKYGFELDKETLEAIVFLASNDHVSVTLYQDDNKVIGLRAWLNDIFGYACSHMEELPLEEAEELADEVLIFGDKGWIAMCLWAQKKNGLEFIEPIKKEIEEFLSKQ